MEDFVTDCSNESLDLVISPRQDRNRALSWDAIFGAICRRVLSSENHSAKDLKQI
jgi:hypothetical protein